MQLASSAIRRAAIMSFERNSSSAVPPPSNGNSAVGDAAPLLPFGESTSGESGVGAAGGGCGDSAAARRMDGSLAGGGLRRSSDDSAMTAKLRSCLPGSCRGAAFDFFASCLAVSDTRSGGRQAGE